MRIVRIPAEGGPTQEIFVPQQGEPTTVRILGSSEDGANLMFVGRRPADRQWSLWRVPVEGGPAEMVGPARPEYAQAVLSPQGQQIALVRSTGMVRELWVLEDAVFTSANPGPAGR